MHKRQEACQVKAEPGPEVDLLVFLRYKLRQEKPVTRPFRIDPAQGPWRVLLFLCLISVWGATPVFPDEYPPGDSTPLEWRELPSLPGAPGVRGMFAGSHNRAFIVAGGVGFPKAWPQESRNKLWYADMYILEPGAEKWRHLQQLARPVAYGTSVTTERGMIFIGGRDAERCYADVTIWRWDPDEKTLLSESLPDLPLPAADLSAEYHEGAVYVLAGQAVPNLRSLQKHFWKLDLTQRPEAWGWEELEPWPGDIHWEAITAVQNAGAEQSYLYLFGGEDPKPGVEDRGDHQSQPGAFRFDLQASSGKSRWSSIAPPPVALRAGSAVPLGQSHVLLFAGSSAFAYHTITDTWTGLGEMPVGAPVARAVRYGEGIVFVSEDRPDANSALRTWMALLRAPMPRFGWINSAVLLLYLATLIVMGLYFSRREKSTADFFLAGRRIPWWAAGFSIYVTQLSAITFISIPAVSFASDWLVFPALLAILMMAPVVVRYYLPFFRRLDLTTAYEYLEKRFNLGLRLFGSISFIAFQLVRMAIVMFLPALALSGLTGINIYACILIMGIMATAYTILGGIEAVIWTDVLQTVVLLGGMIVTFILILVDIGGPGTALATALEHQKLRITDWTWSLTALATWSIVLGNFALQFGPYTTDQAVIQRYLTTRDERSAARGIWLNGIGSVVFGTLFFAMGTCMYVFFKLHPELLRLGMQNDEIFPLFIGVRLPVGISGLVIAGIFAASMSSLDSSMHSISTVVTTDFYRRFRPDAGEGRLLRLARIIIASLGLLVMAVAFLLARYDIQSLYFFFNKALGLVSSGIVGIFILGIFTRRGSALGAWVGAGVSVVVLIYVTWFSPLHFYLYPVVGIGVCVIVGFVASLFGSVSKDLKGLTYRTLAK